MTGIRITPFGVAPKISNLVVDQDLDMGAYAVKADSVKVGSISEKTPGNGVSIDSAIIDSAIIDVPMLLRGGVDGTSGVFGLDATRPIIKASETSIYAKSYSASDRKSEVGVSCIIPEFMSGNINLYYTGHSSDSKRNKGYKFYKNDTLLKEDFTTDSGTVTGTLDVNVSEGDTLKIVGYGSGGSYVGGTNFTIAFRGDITDGIVSQTLTIAPGVYPTTISSFTVED